VIVKKGSIRIPSAGWALVELSQVSVNCHLDFYPRNLSKQGENGCVSSQLA
jgi:hypothetical protein